MKIVAKFIEEFVALLIFAFLPSFLITEMFARNYEHKWLLMFVIACVALSIVLFFKMYMEYKRAARALVLSHDLKKLAMHPAVSARTKSALLHTIAHCTEAEREIAAGRPLAEVYDFNRLREKVKEGRKCALREIRLAERERT